MIMLLLRRTTVSSLTLQYLMEVKKKIHQAMAQLSLIIIKQTIIMCFHPLPPRSIDFYGFDSNFSTALRQTIMNKK